ncbi:MAG TPA: hypothetical protein VFG21_05075 [Xanthomonadaceae bacterium]|nr:hypothetical protein [Xanthomonadaceae bacterium]
MALVYSPGLALYLYPAELLRFGATHTAADDEAVTAEHYFLCLSADAREGCWTPLHVTRGQDRQHIPESAKSGHPRFSKGVSWYSTGDLWRIPHKAVQRASMVAGDKSTAKAPNRVAPAWVPDLALFTKDATPPAV